MSVIKIQLNKDGRAVAILYGKEFDVTELADKSGKGEFVAFHKKYQFEIVKSKSEAKRKAVVKKPISVDDQSEAESIPVNTKG